MIHPSEELLVAWDSLATVDAKGDGWRSIALSRQGSIPLRAGRRFPGQAEAILAQFSTAVLPPQMKLPEGGGFYVERVSLGDSSVYIALTKRESASLELFSAMADDVVSILAKCPANDEPKALASLIGRVKAWQEFMRKGGQPLGPESEIGLFGELSLLQSLLAMNMAPAELCEAWQGPLNGLRDFELGTGGIEVKSTISSIGFPAHITSLEQLDDTERQPLFVAAVRLKQTASGQNLPDSIRAAMNVVASDAEAKRLFDERLIAVGYRHSDADQYVRKFEIVETRIFRVGHEFPRLTPNSVPYGVVRASYNLDLDKATTEMVDLYSALQELKAI